METLQGITTAIQTFAGDEKKFREEVSTELAKLGGDVDKLAGIAEQLKSLKSEKIRIIRCLRIVTKKNRAFESRKPF